jgi:hypothetical protein
MRFYAFWLPNFLFDGEVDVEGCVVLCVQVGWFVCKSVVSMSLPYEISCFYAVVRVPPYESSDNFEDT